MKERINRPPPLTLAPPPKSKKMKAVRETIAPVDRVSEDVNYNPSDKSQKPKSVRSRRSRRRKQSKTFFWVQLTSNILHLHICALLVAALGTFIHDVPAAVKTPAGQTSIAAIVILTISALLSFPTLLRPTSPPALWVILSRTATAISLLAVFLTWAVRPPSLAIFTPGYRLWDLTPDGSNALVAAMVLLIGIHEFARVVAGKSTLARALGPPRRPSPRMKDAEIDLETGNTSTTATTTRRPSDGGIRRTESIVISTSGENQEGGETRTQTIGRSVSVRSNSSQAPLKGGYQDTLRIGGTGLGTWMAHAWKDPRGNTAGN